MLRRRKGSWGAIGAFLGCLGIASIAQAQTAFISEVFVNPPSGDNGFEAVEITGTPGASLNGWVFAIIDGDSTNSGNVTISLPLDGFTLGANGVLLIRDAATDLFPAPEPGTTVVVFDFDPDMQNGTQTYVLGMGAFPGVGADLDTDNDGTIDAPLKGFVAMDAVAYTDGAAADSEYADDFGFPAANLGAVSPHAIYRVLTTGNAPFSWAGGTVTGANPGPYNWGASTFGWQSVGVPDPTIRTLDLGGLNYVFVSEGAGACCLPSGACVTATAQDCIAKGGTFQGDNTDCGTVQCPQPTGACCVIGGCIVTTASMCAEQFGSYQGDNTTCDPNPCPQPTGACCLGDGSCEQMTEADCVAAGGLFSGVGFPCDTIFCLPADPGPVFLTEIFFNSPGADNGNEAIEIMGPPNFSLDGWLLIVIDGDTTSAGIIDQKISLRGLTLGANGILLIRDADTVLLPEPDPQTNVAVIDFTPDIENGANTYVLGYGRFDHPVGTDLDTDNDGAFDVPIGNFTARDAVAFSDPSNTPSVQYAGLFGGEDLGDVTSLPPGALYRILDTNLDPFSWAGGFTTGAAPGPFFWSPTSFFGFVEVGILDPSTRTLDLGSRNYVFVESACPCDFNADDSVNSQDFFDFLSCFFVNECLDADFNGDGFVNSQDFFDFLNCFFAPPIGC